MVQFCREAKGVLTITLHVQPRAKKTEIIGVHGEALKIKVAAPPVDGAANEALIAFFAKYFGIAKSGIHIKQGSASKHKVLEVTGVTEAQFTQLLLKQGVLRLQLG